MPQHRQSVLVGQGTETLRPCDRTRLDGVVDGFGFFAEEQVVRFGWRFRGNQSVSQVESLIRPAVDRHTADQVTVPASAPQAAE
jgi:hypothetical protein